MHTNITGSTKFYFLFNILIVSSNKSSCFGTFFDGKLSFIILTRFISLVNNFSIIGVISGFFVESTALFKSSINWEVNNGSIDFGFELFILFILIILFILFVYFVYLFLE